MTGNCASRNFLFVEILIGVFNLPKAQELACNHTLSVASIYTGHVVTRSEVRWSWFPCVRRYAPPA